MDSPHVGFRRLAATSWILGGIGIAGVLGTSMLAYSDTVEKQSADTADDPADAAPAAPQVYGPTTSTTGTPMAPSYAPDIHTRSQGS